MSTILAFLILSASGLDIDENQSYLVIDAVSVKENGKQPTWFAFIRGLKTFHVPATDGIIQLPPGKYILDHIDFQNNKHLGYGTFYLDGKGIKFTLEAGKVYIFGRVILHHLHRDDYEIELGEASKTLFNACQNAPDIFDAFNVNTFGKMPEFKLSCEEQK